MTRRRWRFALHRGLPAAAVCVTAGGVFLMLGFQGQMHRDLGVYTYAGQQVADGSAPYVNIVNRVGPIAHLAPGLGMVAGRLVGLDDVLAARAAFMLVSIAAVYAVFRLARLLLASTALAAATALTLVMVNGFTVYATQGPREKTLMILLAVLAMETTARQQWFRTGALIGLATLTYQPVFFPAIAAALTMLALHPGGRSRGLVRLTLGGLLPLALVLAWYAVIGHLQDFLDAFLLINLRYTEQSGLLTDAARPLRAAMAVYGPSFWVLVLGLLTALGAAVTAARRLRRSDALPGDAFVVALGAASLGALLWSVRAYNGWPDALLLFTFTVPGFGLLLRALRDLAVRSPTGPAPVHRQQTGWVVAAVWCLVATLIGSHYSLTHRSDDLVGQRARAHRLLAVLGDDATMESVQAPAPLVLTGRDNATRHQMFSLGLESYVDDTWPGGLSGFASDMLARRPDVLAVQRGFRPEWLDEVLRTGYVRVGLEHDGGYTFHVSNDLEAEVIQRARRAVRR